MISLEERKHAIEQRLHALGQRRRRIDAHQTNRDREVPQDFADQAQFRENDEVVDALGAHAQRDVAQLLAALGRIETGTYGICLGCGDTIADARLDAMPEATLCVGCADRIQRAPRPTRR
ncbi:MAG: TraR/DksA family transcriptional regulator [Myxococcota bacterium]